MPAMPRAPASAEAAAQTAAPKPKSAAQLALQRMGLVRDIDLALHLPLRYEDDTRLTAVAALREGEPAQCEVVVTRCEVQLKGRRTLVVRAEDEAGDELLLRFLHFYPSHQKTLQPGQRIRLRGEARGGFFGREMVHPQFKVVQPGEPLPQRLTPIYPSTAALPQAYLRRAVEGGLQRAELREFLPAELLPPGLPPLRDCLLQLHQPPKGMPMAALEDRSHPCWQRLKFEELLAQQLSQLQAKAERALQRSPAFAAERGGLQEKLLAALPFALTRAQHRVVQEIVGDLARKVPMHRLLQGDVGAGKTVVAALAAAVVMQQGWQVALMAPTEILAEQHFKKLVGWLEPLGIGVAWLSGSRKGKARQDMVERVADGRALLVVGTHAVIQADVEFQRLGLAIIDEQHRFGVAQRLALRQKLQGDDPEWATSNTPSLEPHLLMMSATPIPRTLAMTVFADLDISTIDELPPGRTPIVTKVFSDTKRQEVIETIAREVSGATPRQVYWVCPLIEESEKLDLQNATATHAELVDALPGHAVGLLHGRMKPAEKAAVMAEFSAGRMAVLVSTTVIEVGVDVPNASLMVIEHAERFGLAQLHQLRGRVGRGSVASVCVLIYTGPLSPTGKDRLRAMAGTTDGFEIARLDLEIRGPGEFLGARQSGTDLLRFADLREDTQLLEQARRAAERLLAKHPEAAQRHLARWRGARADFLKA
jgi:ATP-dependent DNA helicase RecG